MFYDESGDTLEQVGQRSCGYHVIGSVQDQVGQDFEQPDEWKMSLPMPMVAGTRWSLKVPSNPFCERRITKYSLPGIPSLFLVISGRHCTNWGSLEKWGCWLIRKPLTRLEPSWTASRGRLESHGLLTYTGNRNRVVLGLQGKGVTRLLAGYLH